MDPHTVAHKLSLPIDLLDLLSRNELTEEQAHKIYDEVISRIHQGDLPADWVSILGFSVREATAFCHAVGLRALAGWRRTGWPDQCELCKAPIGATNWWAMEDSQGKGVLVHLSCLPVEKEA